ncbi:photosynthetic NDH subunit of subcomplex B 1, chloroplastic [Daucus carota subsp. sativus]|uniref:photosynthetic NDH subunit of subcomplex B 1, chloroplastic n=1 Tax=Daucus carota subsp. sativus TaxID=79200 RepID=UPI0007EFB5E8|nr:PREDICTED: photosynthetic NDH subunit of subcomplex B 1, chloroplastic [Daucus carota subsp. sativus]
MASATSACLLPKPVAPKFPCSPTIVASATHLTNAPFLNNASLSDQLCHAPRPCFRRYAKKNGWLDPFDFGDDPEMEYGSMYSEGKQDEDPRPPESPDNPYGFLKFPMGYGVEVASLGLKIRGDVRRCCCVISGGVYENLLFFPTIQLIKARYPGVQVDVLASPRGKQTYELNKNVRWADAYDADEDFPDPAEYTDMIGILKNRYYDMILSTKLAGLGHASFLFMTTARDRVSYVYPNVNSAGAGLLLSQTFTPDCVNLSDGGYHMYHQMTDWLGRPARGVPREPLPPLKVSISRKLKEYVMEKYTKAGVEKGKYVVIHGIQSDSKASMQSRGDTDSLLPIQTWAEITSTISSGVKPVFVIPHEKVREDVEDIIGEEASIVFISTPGQLAALINDSVGVIATNTAAVQLSNAREKPCIALFSSEEKGKLFVPDADVKKCKIISSKTGVLADIDIETIKAAVQIFERPLALV